MNRKRDEPGGRGIRGGIRFRASVRLLFLVLLLPQGAHGFILLSGRPAMLPCRSRMLDLDTRQVAFDRPLVKQRQERTRQDVDGRGLYCGHAVGDADASEGAIALPPEREILSCRIKGFYPFPQGINGPVAWLFRDTHQAIVVSTTAGNCTLLLDFMTSGGQAHPVWFDETTKWKVFLGQNIRGEVRIRSIGSVKTSPQGSKIERFRAAAAAYDNNMNIYANNCRIFCTRMEREVERLNSEDADYAGQPTAAAMADARLAFGILRAVALPMLYPALIIWICWAGLGDM